MALWDPVALVRCRLGPPPEGGDEALRYVPLVEFGLWKHLMETRHRRTVTLEAVSVWVPEDPALWTSGFDGDSVEPILRFHAEVAGPAGAAMPVERFFPADSYPAAQEALLSHYPGEPGPKDVTTVPGYFVPPAEPGPLALPRNAV